MTQALLVIDIQNDYFPDGKMELVGAAKAAKNAAIVMSRFREQGLPVIHVQHIAVSPTATFFLPETFGVEIHRDVAPMLDELVVVKHFPNAFRATALKEVLESLKVDELAVVGMMTHMCIDTTVRARNLEFNGHTVDAQNVQAAYLAAIDGSFARVVSADAFSKF
jgi:nicotinamidase-related amidase